MAIIEETVRSDFRIGDTLGKIFNIFFSKFIPLNLLVLIIQGPLIIWAYFWDAEAISYVGENPLEAINWSQISITFVLALVLYYVATAAVTYGVFQELSGRKLHVGESLSKGLSVTLSTIFAGIMLFVIVLIGGVILGGAGSVLFNMFGWLGAILFVIPAVYALLIFLVVLPVVIVENPGVFASFGRSVELTKNSRWALLGMLVIFGVMLAATDWLFEMISTSILLMNFDLAVTIGTFVYQVLKTTIGIVFIAVIYNNLRVSKEGVSPNQIASVFD